MSLKLLNKYEGRNSLMSKDVIKYNNSLSATKCNRDVPYSHEVVIFTYFDAK